MSEFKCPEPDCAFTIGSDYPMFIELHGRWHRSNFGKVETVSTASVEVAVEDQQADDCRARMHGTYTRWGVAELGGVGWSTATVAVLAVAMALVFLVDRPIVQLVAGLVGFGVVVSRLVGICRLARQAERDLVQLATFSSTGNGWSAAVDGFLRAGRDG